MNNDLSNLFRRRYIAVDKPNRSDIMKIQQRTHSNLDEFELNIKVGDVYYAKCKEYDKFSTALYQEFVSELQKKYGPYNVKRLNELTDMVFNEIHRHYDFKDGDFEAMEEQYRFLIKFVNDLINEGFIK